MGHLAGKLLDDVTSRRACAGQEEKNKNQQKSRDESKADCF